MLKNFLKLTIFLFLFFLNNCQYKEDDYQVLENAIRKGKIKEVNSIIDEKNIDLNPKYKNWAPLMIAAFRNNKEIVDLLLKKGADIQIRNKQGQAPLHLSSRWGKKEMVEHLIKKGAFLEARDSLSWTPLMWASLRGRKEIVKLLLENNANVNIRDIDGNTPLILTAFHNQIETAKILLSYGANKYLKTNDGKTACDIALKKDFKKFYKFLSPCN